MAAVAYTDSIISPNNYRPLPTVTQNAYSVYESGLVSNSIYISPSQTLLSGFLYEQEVIEVSDVTGISSGGPTRPTSGLVYPRLI